MKYSICRVSIDNVILFNNHFNELFNTFDKTLFFNVNIVFLNNYVRDNIEK